MIIFYQWNFRPFFRELIGVIEQQYFIILHGCILSWIMSFIVLEILVSLLSASSLHFYSSTISDYFVLYTLLSLGSLMSL